MQTFIHLYRGSLGRLNQSIQFKRAVACFKCAAASLKYAAVYLNKQPHV